MHGDQFDAVQHRYARTARIAATIHEGVLGSSHTLNGLLQSVGVQRKRFGTLLTSPIKQLVQFYSGAYQRKRHAVHAHACDGLVSGHTHSPGLHVDDACLLANCGDWLEHCSCVVETYSGQLELWSATPQQWSAMRPQRRALSPAGSDES